MCEISHMGRFSPSTRSLSLTLRAATSGHILKRTSLTTDQKKGKRGNDRGKREAKTARCSTDKKLKEVDPGVDLGDPNFTLRKNEGKGERGERNVGTQIFFFRGRVRRWEEGGKTRLTNRRRRGRKRGWTQRGTEKKPFPALLEFMI